MITPKDNDELKLLSELLLRLQIVTTVIEEEREDLGMGLLIQEADKSQHSSREAVFKALGQL